MGKQKDFVAINILCMYPNKATACSIGLVKVKDNKVVDEFHSLISPPAELKFTGFNMVQDLHGITETQTDGKPTFIELLPKIEEFIEELPMVVHNGIVEYWTFIRALEYYRGKGIEISSYLEGKHLIDTSRMHDWVPFYKKYETIHDARLYAEFYISQDKEDVLYPKVVEKKRPDVTHEHMTYIKGREKISEYLYEEFDIETAEFKDNPFLGKRFYLSGELSFFESKDKMCILMRNKLGAIPVPRFTKSGSDAIIGGGQTGVSKSRLPNAINWGKMIAQEEDVFNLLMELGVEDL